MALDRDAKATGLKEITMKKGELEQRLTGQGGVLGGKREAAEVDGGHSDGGHPADKILFAIEEGGAGKGFPEGAAFEGRRIMARWVRHKEMEKLLL
jgi:hypothetical protein